MSIRGWIVLSVAWILSLVAVGTAAFAQAQAWRPVPEPRVLSGADVGFRVEGFRGEIPGGRIVIRVNGEWREAEIAPRNPTLLR